MTDLRTRLSRLPPEKRALLEQRLRGDPAASPDLRAGARGDGPVPLSFAQERLWFLDRLDPGSAAYNVPFPLRIRGALDVPSLERALAEVVRRHESLRTRFPMRDGGPVQHVEPAGPVRLSVMDLGRLPERARTAELHRLAAEEAQRPFDLAAGPLLRVAVLRLAAEEAAVLFTVHHIVSDGWSMGILSREISALYAGYSRGEEVHLPPLPIQYADHSVWQRRRLSGEALEREIAYWRERLEGAPAVLEMPADRPRPRVTGDAGAEVGFELASGTAAALRGLSRQEGATPFMALLAAWQFLLARCSGQDDVLVGTPIAGRTRKEVEGLVGFFVNTLVLHARIPEAATFRKLLRNVRETTLGAYQHQELPFEKLVEELGVPRSLAHTPLFQVMFSFQAREGGGPHAGDGRLETLEVPGSPVKFDLTLSLAEEGDEIRGTLAYRAELWERDSMERLLERYGRILDAVAGDPDLHLADVSLLGSGERAQLLEAWGSGPASEGARDCVHELFAAQAARAPDAVAIRHRGTTLSYAELDRRSARLANALRQRGVGPEVPVGVCLPRTPELIVALLGVLRAGGAYVPLDPAYPRARLGDMVEDARVRLVLTESALMDRLPESVPEVRVLDRERDALAAGPDRAPESGVRPDNLAYILFTSGSTGRPKGVMVRHASVAVLLHGLREVVSDEERGSVLFSTSVSFDVSVAEIFGTLCWGGTGVLVENALELTSVSDEDDVRLVVTVPTAAAELVRSGGVPASVRAFNLAGEALPGELVRALYGLGHVETVRNLYGPTEDTVYSTGGRVERGSEAVGIGRPLANTRAYVLDARLEPVPVGVVGELYLSGEGVARGYAGRPELTGERFVPDPFGTAGRRMYRTGDRARWLSTGEMEYQGRADAQVKVRGYRIELGEIETALRTHAAVSEAVVVVREGESGEPWIVAYVVAQEGAAAEPAELRSHLRARLPEYMVPSAFVPLDRLPLTGSGKVDRKALPAPGAPAASAAYVAPRTPVEEVLAGLWSEVLGRERVGAEDDFFALGGHSLLATRVVSRIRDAFGVELPLRALFESPTVAGLAARLDALRGEATGPQAPPILPVPRDGSPLPLSFAQQRLWFIDQLEPGRAAYNIPLSLLVHGALDLPALERALTEVVRRHEALRTRFPVHGGEPVQHVDPARPVQLPVVELGGMAEPTRAAELERLVAEEGGRPFDLAAGPLLRAGVVRLGEARSAVLFTLHHAVSDGWSLGILAREVSTMYGAYSRGEAPRLPELAVQYADYAVWQRAWLSGEVLERQIGYWRERLEGAPAVLDLPTDRPRPAVASDAGARCGLELSAETTGALRALARREGVTVFMALLGAWQHLLGRYAGSEDVVVGTPIAGRNRLETEGLIGLFVNTLALRGELGGEPTYREALRRARETTLGAYQHQDLPFEKLVEELGVPRSLAHTPLFQVLFSFQNAPEDALDLGGATVEDLGSERSAVRFDLSLSLVEAGEGFEGVLLYRKELWDAPTVARLADCFGLLLSEAVAHPERRLAEVSLLRGAERAQVLETWNRTGADWLRERCIHEAFSEQAARTPDAVAVVSGGRSLGYAELERASARLARRLRARGVGPESRVGLFVDRCLEVPVGILGILKAGAAFVPLDPTHPAPRIRHLLEDAGIGLVVTLERLASTVPSGPDVLCLDGDGLADSSVDAVATGVPVTASGATPENAAYVIYTSGSTGRPKGVVVTHRSVMNLHAALDRAVYGPRGGGPARVSLNGPLTFDTSVKQWVQLLGGSTLYVVPEEVRRDGAALAGYLRETGVEVFDCTPAQLRMLVVEGLLERLGPTPTDVLLGGEAVDEGLWTLLSARMERRFHNLYGPTECTVDATHCRVGESAGPGIGRPIANARAYVLDAGLQPVGVGMPGELYLAGAGVARGYLGQPGLSAERFLPDPYADEGGGRMYRTGDRARWTAEGMLEYLGRVDQQVKVRGFRIEPGEVEAALREEEGIADAAVVVREEGAGGGRLVAYVVGTGGPVAVGELRARLGARLPEYMVPSAIVAMETFPLTPNGKLDRRGLPAPEHASGGYVAPRTPTEQVLCGIWAEVLDLQSVSAEDDFFALGGHSLLATRVVSRVRRAFRTELPVRALFEAPTVARLAARIDAAVADRARKPAPSLVPAPRDRPLPLSFAQQRLWFIDQLEPGSPAYNMPYALRLRGRLDPALLRRALAEVVRRHETLRTVFGSVDGEPVQRIRAASRVALPVADLRWLPAEAREAELHRLAGEEAHRPFDLGAGPLLRARVVRVGEAEWGVLFTLHHVVSDGWSMGVLTREVTELYDALGGGRKLELPELRVQYADYAAWQRAWLSGARLEAHLGYWRERLADAPPFLELPTDRPRTRVPDPRAATAGFEIARELADGLRTLSRDGGATPFMTLLAAWKILLARYAGTDDVVVGSPVAGRTRVELEPLIGVFVNTLVLRTDLSGEPDFRELLKRVRETTLGAFQHQELPFERLVEEVAPERSLARSPLFQVMFSLTEARRSELRLGGTQAAPIASDEGDVAKFDLTLDLLDTGDSFHGSLSWRVDLFDRGTVERMAEHYLALLGAVAASPRDRVHGIDFLSPAERSQLLAEWGATADPGLPFHPAHEHPGRHARISPDAVAVVFEGTALTYAEFDERTGRLARALARRGVGSEVRVGVCMERSLALPTAILAVLRAGGACVPLDPATPPGRLAHVLADAGAPILLADASTAGRVPGFTGEVLLVEAELEASDREDPAPDLAVDPRSAAYVIYTSGSTGRPRGVVVEHGALASHVGAFASTLGFGPGDRVLHSASIGFDVSMEQLLVALNSGATLVLRGNEPWEPAEWPARVRDLGVTVADLPPAYWREVVESAGESPLPGLRLLVVGADTVPSALVPGHRAALAGPARIVNGYGPTEAVVTATTYEVPAAFPGDFAGPVVPIGRPLPGRTAYVLDRLGAPVPARVPGELYLGGSGLGRGYQRHPDLTARAWLPDPFSGEPGARMYRTGDRARWLASGELEFLGRVDQQVKIRGFRIEPGEVEAVLCEHPAVREAAVVVRDDGAGERRLVAYVAGPAPVEAELRDLMRDRLPEYMVPAALVVLDRMPLTSSGKVDRRALPAPEWTEDGTYAAPRTPTEEVLSGIWAAVLGLERVGVHDGFFALGGHSLLATRVAARVRESFGVELPVRALFEAPTVARLAARIDAAVANRAGKPGPSLVPAPRDRPLPLSFAQQRLWFIDQLEPGSPVYNMPYALRLRGRLDPALLRRALTEIVRRHETLRTAFESVDGEPVQRIRDAARVALPVADLRGLPAEAREAELHRLAGEEAHRPFDLAAGPLLRARVVRVGEAEWGVLFTLHHVVSDGWSMGVLTREVSELYDALGGGREPELPELRVQYADYAAWQRAWLTGATLEAHLGYWRGRLAGAPPLLELPTDRPRPDSQDARGGVVGIALPADLTDALAALSRREGVTLFMTLLAGLQVLLARYAGTDDVVVGSPIAGRTRVELEPLIGFFANTLALRTDLSGSPSVRDVLGRVREAALGAYQHQDLPFERLVEEIAPERSLAHSPLFQVLFALQNDGDGELALGPGRIEPLEAGAPVAKFDLTFGLHAGEHVSGAVVYRASLWDHGTVERLVAHLGAVLRGMADDPTRPVSELDLLDAGERARVLEEWNATDGEYPVRGGLAALFEARAAEAPDRAAVVFRDRTLSYGELEGRANRLARRLRALGAGPDARVGLCVERSLETAVGVLAILKAGAAYVPLDPAYPADRLAYMLEDSRCRVILTQESLLDRLPDAGPPRIALDAFAWDAGDGSPPTVEAPPESLAYVIYTSGSTGRPKGVAMTQRPLLNLVAWQLREWAGRPAARTLQFASISFDVAFQEMWTTWASGGTLVVAPAEARADAAALARLVDEARVERLFLPFVALQHLAEAASEQGIAPASLREVITAGEQLRVTEPIRRWLAAHPGCELVNQYGPSETHVVSALTLDGAPVGWPLLPGIGRPVANTRLYVLGEGLTPVPVGVPGELYVGGDSLARGYLDRPGQTAERFVPDPFGRPGARLYRTGDRARWVSGGELEFLGRADHQVKVRGFRVEPGEVEAALERHPSVREALVIVREDAPGDRRLVAYVVAAAGAEPPSATELRGFLALTLPEYMVPAALAVLDAFPLTPSGKLDRRSLPAPVVTGEGGADATPRTPAEEVVAAIYAEVLGAGRVGRQDGFFALGGHSLLATRVVSRVRDAFGVELPLRALFESPTVAGLAVRLDALLDEATGPEAPPILRLPRDGSSLPLSFAQQRLWFIDQLEPGRAAYNIPLSLLVHGALDLPALERSLTEVVRRHEALRTRFPLHGGEPVQHVDPARPVRLPVVELGGLAEPARTAELARLVAEEGGRPFDLAAGPLLRAGVVRLDESRSAVLFTLHHAVGDGWSLGILAREVSTLYGAYSRGEASPLPELAVQYADYAVWQRAWLSGEELERQIGYWRERLAGAPAVLELPTDRPRPAVASDTGARCGVELPAETTGALRALARREGVTVFMALLGAWQHLLGRYAGSEDVVVGTPIAGRNRLETEGLIGLFVNTLALRGELGGEPTYREVLRRARETTLGAYQHQDLPFEKLVEELGVPRSLAHTPLFQVLFSFQNHDGGRLELGETGVEALGADGGPVKFDLTMTLAEAGDVIHGTLSYRAELWERGSMERLLERYTRVLDAVMEDPDLPLPEVSLLGAGERSQVLETWNRTGADWPRERCIHEAFSEQAARTPDAVAVVSGGRSLGYAELERASTRLARRLRARGVGPESRVGLFLDRCLEVPVGILGILKAGAAFVPLDPTHPAPRIRHLLDDAGIGLVVTLERLASSVPSGPDVLCLDGDGLTDSSDEAAATTGEAAPASGATPENAAYVIYTSGSTGTPKGVVVTHRSVMNLHAALDRAVYSPRGGGPARVSLNGPLTFDTSVKQWVQLLGGSTLYVVPEEVRRDGAALAAFLRDTGVEVFDCTPAQLRMLVAEGLLERLGPTPTDVLLGGEAVDEGLWTLLSARRERRFHNLYGPTECTVDATHCRVGGSGGPGIGRPIANARAYVLDAGLQPVGVGMPGELYLAGAGVARGYLGQPGLSAERFLPDPYADEGGGRMYRTGDRARWTAEGMLEYLGRVDQQVKVRGFRIEPGEVEAALREEEGIADAAVVVREEGAGGGRLVAYVVGTGGPVAVGELRARLGARLPEYMVPSAVVAMETFPLTPNGKLDRRGLPAPEYSPDEYVAPRTGTEEMVAGIWAEVLGLERVGAEDDFFRLGGHSLLAMRLVARLREAADVEVSVRVVFEAPTVAAMAAWVDSQHPEAELEAWEVEEEEALLAGLSDEEVRRLLEEL